MQRSGPPDTAGPSALPLSDQPARNVDEAFDTHVFKRQMLLEAFLTYSGESSVLLNADDRHALRWTSRAVRDLVDARCPLTKFKIGRGEHSLGAALDRPLAASMVAVDLDAPLYPSECSKALKELLNHHRAANISKLRICGSALGYDAQTVAERLAALPALTFLHLHESTIKIVSQIISKGSLNSIQDLTLFTFQERGWASTKEVNELWKALASLPRLTRLFVGNYGLQLPETLGIAFSTLEEIQLGSWTLGTVGSLNSTAAPLSSFVWPKLRHFDFEHGLKQSVVEDLQSSSWIHQLTCLRLDVAEDCRVLPLVATLSGSTVLRELSLWGFKPQPVLSGTKFPCLETLGISFRIGQQEAPEDDLPNGLLQDILSASLPRLRSLSLGGTNADRDFKVPAGSPQRPFPLLRRLSVNLSNLKWTDQVEEGADLPACIVVPLNLMPSVEEATFSFWDSPSNILNALTDALCPAWPMLRVLRLQNYSPLSISSLSSKAAHFPALEELWISPVDLYDDGFYDERKYNWEFNMESSVERNACSGCWPNLKRGYLWKLGHYEYHCIWQAAD